MKTTLSLLVAASAALVFVTQGASELSWDELIPQAPAAVAHPPAGQAPVDSSMSPAPEAYGVVDNLDGETVKIPGFIVPLESDEGGLLNEFFLVPYFGACIHVPPPPPNQIVYVTLEDPFNLETMWEPYWIEGTLRTKSHVHAMGASAYSLEGTKVYPYEY